MYVYVVRPGAKLPWKGQTLTRGAILYADDAREIEAPEHRHHHHHLVRVPESAFPHLFDKTGAPIDAAIAIPDLAAVAALAGPTGDVKE